MSVLEEHHNFTKYSLFSQTIIIGICIIGLSDVLIFNNGCNFICFVKLIFIVTKLQKCMYIKESVLKMGMQSVPDTENFHNLTWLSAQ